MLDIPGMKREAEGHGEKSLLGSLPIIGKSISDSMSAFKRFQANYTGSVAKMRKRRFWPVGNPDFSNGRRSSSLVKIDLSSTPAD
jgi:hypothetical protein